MQEKCEGEFKFGTFKDPKENPKYFDSITDNTWPILRFKFRTRVVVI